MSSGTVALVLAAGFSNRFGSIKLCASLDNGATVFEQTLRNLEQAVSEVIVVTRPELAEDLIQHCDSLQIFDQAEKGMGATLAYGIGLVQESESCLVCLADMPFIKPESYRELAQTLTRENIVQPCFDDQPANPVGFGQRYYAELMALTGDSGGRPVLQAHSDSVLRISLDDPGLVADIDTPEELARFQQSLC